MSITFNLADARRVWSHRQRLGATSDPAEVAGGWIRSLGGVDPYLALFARHPGLKRAEVDRLLADASLWVVPGVRNCIWLVPDADRALALSVSDAQARRRTDREMRKLDVSVEALATLAQQVVAALETGPKSPEALRSALPDGAVRSLGAAGKKIGHSSTLPTALRHLEWAGKLRRLHRDGRVDTNRYEWALSEEDLVAGAPADLEAQAVALARRYFDWAGPATLEAFVAWTLVGKRAARAAIAALELVEVTVEGSDAPAYAFADRLDAPADDAVYLLPSQDPLLALREGLAQLVDPEHHAHEVLGMGGRKAKLGSVSWLLQRPIVHRGTIVGLWEYDPDAAEVVYAGLSPLTGALAERTAARATEVGAFIRDELEGNPKQVSIDSEKSVRTRVEALRG